MQSRHCAVSHFVAINVAVGQALDDHRVTADAAHNSNPNWILLRSWTGGHAAENNAVDMDIPAIADIKRDPH
jgi:hypothetical protein